MYRIEFDSTESSNFKFGNKYFENKDDAMNFIVDHLLKKSNNEVDSTIFDEIEENFTIVDASYDFCGCGCRN